MQKHCDRKRNAAAPTVSVLMPLYDAAAYVREAIDSVLAQSLSDLELVIVDDGSTDDGVAIAHEAAAGDARVQVFENARNMGQAATRNRALALARGAFIALMDADDRCHPERLAQQLDYLSAHSDVAVVGSCWAPIGVGGDSINRTRPRRQRFSSDQIAALMLFCCPVHHPTLTARAGVFGDYRYDESFAVAQDHELWSRMTQHHRFAVLPEVLMYYRQHPNQAIAGLDRIRCARERIYAAQLQRLGVSFDQDALHGHFHLFRFKGRRLFAEQTGRALDLAFVRWARCWMERLLAANRRHRLYPEPVFSNFIAARWLFVCRKAAGGNESAVAVWREFLASPLARRIPAAVRAGEIGTVV